MDEQDRKHGAPDDPAKSRKEKTLEKIGMHFPKGKEDQVHLQPRFFKFLGFLGILVLICSVGMFEFSTSPYFCASCHIMKPYYESWSTSTHRDVACIKCHIAPGIKAEAMKKMAKAPA